MDCKKRLNRAKQRDEVENKTPQKVPGKNSESAGTDFMDYCNSPDFPSSQECFTVGWDWSGQVRGNNKPTIRVVERPVRKRNEAVELLECHRPRRIVRNYDPDMFDASSYVDQLKSLASGLKRVPESHSPVASPPNASIRRRGDLVITPTSLRSAHKDPSSKVGRSESSTSETPKHKMKPDVAESEKSLNDLLDDSLGADLLKFTQDIEQNLKENGGKTPKPPKNLLEGLPSSKKKSRLSLSSKNETNSARNNVCRRIDDVYEVTHDSLSTAEKCGSGNTLSSCHENKDKTNNNFVPLGMEFDDFDEATLLSINELEEKVLTKSDNTSSAIKSSGSSMYVNKTDTTDVHPILEDDDDFVSPDVLDVIDQCEKKATQNFAEVTNTVHLPKPGPSSCERTQDLIGWIDKQHEERKQSEKEKDLGKSKNQIHNQRKGLSLASAGLKSPPGKMSTSTRGESLDLCSWIDKQHNEKKQSEKEKEAVKSKNQIQSHKKSLSLASSGLKYTPEEIEKKRQEAIRKRLQLKRKQP